MSGFNNASVLGWEESPDSLNTGTQRSLDLLVIFFLKKIGPKHHTLRALQTDLAVPLNPYNYLGMADDLFYIKLQAGVKDLKF